MIGVQDPYLGDLWNETYFKNSDLWECSLELTIFQTFAQWKQAGAASL